MNKSFDARLDHSQNVYVVCVCVCDLFFISVMNLPSTHAGVHLGKSPRGGKRHFGRGGGGAG